MKTFRRTLVTFLLLIMAISMFAIQAFAANTTDIDFIDFTAYTRSDFFNNLNGRTKTDTSPVYVHISKSTYAFTRVCAFGMIDAEGIYGCYNRTYYNGETVPFVRCYRGTGYSVRSTIKEGNFPYASLGFQSAGATDDVISGWWSADSSKSHTIATP